jgi:hypothetical protein
VVCPYRSLETWNRSSNRAVIISWAASLTLMPLTAARECGGDHREVRGLKSHTWVLSPTLPQSSSTRLCRRLHMPWREWSLISLVERLAKSWKYNGALAFSRCVLEDSANRDTLLACQHARASMYVPRPHSCHGMTSLLAIEVPALC